MSPPIALIVFIVAGIVALIASHGKTKDDMVAFLAKYSCLIGLIFWLWSVAK